MVERVFFADLALVDQRLDVGMVHGAEHHLAVAEMVDAGVARVDPVAVTARVDQKGCDGAVGFLLSRDRRQFDDQVRLFARSGATTAEGSSTWGSKRSNSWRVVSMT